MQIFLVLSENRKKNKKRKKTKKIYKSKFRFDNETSLLFKLTNSQETVLNEINKDLMSKKECLE